MEAREREELLNRLLRLERELVAVRRDLRDQVKVAIPAGTFQAIRVQVGGELYAVPSADVRQIIRYARVTRVSNAPRAAHGVLNVRGQIVVILDVSERLGLGRVRLDLRTPVVIVSVHDWLVGLVVERVLDVVSLDGSTLTEPSGAIGASVCVAAVGSVGGQLVQVFDLDQLLSPSELERMESPVADPESLAEGQEAGQ